MEAWQGGRRRTHSCPVVPEFGWAAGMGDSCTPHGAARLCSTAEAPLPCAEVEPSPLWFMAGLGSSSHERSGSFSVALHVCGLWFFRVSPLALKSCSFVCSSSTGVPARCSPSQPLTIFLFVCCFSLAKFLPISLKPSSF